MKKRNPRPVSGIKRFCVVLMILLLTVLQHNPALALSLSDSSNPIPAAAMKLVQFCIDPRVGLDSQAIATLVDYVLGPKSNKEASLPTNRNAAGAYYEFDTRIDFPSFLKYSFNKQIPSVLTSPSSLRYSQWVDAQGNPRNFSSLCDLTAHDGQPLVLRGLEHVGITPDLNTGVYYKYDLKKTLILLKHKGRQVLISVSKQTDISDVGKKGIILGNDDDWNYYYSGETGSAKTGLGWVKSYIYDYFSVGVYVPGSSSSTVRSGFFSWIRAGWSGINFAESKHVLKGLQRHARSTKIVLESPKLPPPNQVASTYLKLSALPRNVLDDKYATLQQARQQLASRKINVAAPAAKQGSAYANTPKEQILSELMLEYFKMSLGKPSLLASRDI
ncbi:hypothetical protein SAMN04489760_10719 [Syntrophus gentianae]|uniref:Uncharacterized protein n=1 Tax=Syntrophus gentianae TaxID=43775 RepID=A0A1H7WKX0_9BACT|nr:hypothetical protein [Syntrophus gentianae]SEM22282.1 hypothetical protein SAMN04489760_10719 [Syntrophus gentianae]